MGLLNRHSKEQAPITTPIEGEEEKKAAYTTTGDAEIGPGEVEEIEKTHRGLKARHAQMIALGGTIGTGLFVGSGSTLAKGGPLFILMGYSILSVLVYGIVSAIIEVAAYLPISGGTMSYYGHRNVSDSLGFAMGSVFTPLPLKNNHMRGAKTDRLNQMALLVLSRYIGTIRNHCCWYRHWLLG